VGIATVPVAAIGVSPMAFARVSSTRNYIFHALDLPGETLGSAGETPAILNQLAFAFLRRAILKLAHEITSTRTCHRCLHHAFVRLLHDEERAITEDFQCYELP